MMSCSGNNDQGTVLVSLVILIDHHISFSAIVVCILFSSVSVEMYQAGYAYVWYLVSAILPVYSFLNAPLGHGRLISWMADFSREVSFFIPSALKSAHRSLRHPENQLTMALIPLMVIWLPR